VCLLFLLTSSFKLRRYSQVIGFLEAADCKFLPSLITFSKEKLDVIMCMLYHSELNVCDQKKSDSGQIYCIEKRNHKYFE